MSSGVHGKDSSGPSFESMRYMIASDEDAKGAKVARKETKKETKKRPAKSVQLGNMQKMLTVSLKKRPEQILEDGEFPKIIQKGAQELISAIHKAADPVLVKKYVEQFTRCEKMLSQLNAKLIDLLQKTPANQKGKRAEIEKLSRIIQSVLRKLHEESDFIESTKPRVIPAPVVGMMGSFVEENEEQVLDELLGQFSGAGGKAVALQEMQKVSKATEKVNEAINQALQKRGEPFTFPPELSKEEIAQVTRLAPRGKLTLDAFCKIIERMPHISDINLQFARANEATLALLGELKELRHINLSRPAEVSVSLLRTIVKSFPQLKSLDISGGGIDDWEVTDEMLDLVCKLKELHTLDLVNAGMNDARLQKLAALTQLRTLNLSGNHDITTVKALSACTELVSLNLNYCIDIATLKGLEACSKLEFLTLIGCRKIEDLAPLSTCTKLQDLCCKGIASVTTLAPLATCAELGKLNLNACDGLTSLEPLRACTQLWDLFLGYCTGITDVEPLSACTKLKELTLPQNVTNLEPLAACAQLEKLKFSWSNPNVLSLLPLLACTKLRELDVSWEVRERLKAEVDALKQAFPQLQIT